MSAVQIFIAILLAPCVVKHNAGFKKNDHRNGSEVDFAVKVMVNA